MTSLILQQSVQQMQAALRPRRALAVARANKTQEEGEEEEEEEEKRL